MRQTRHSGLTDHKSNTKLTVNVQTTGLLDASRCCTERREQGEGEQQEEGAGRGGAVSRRSRERGSSREQGAGSRRSRERRSRERGSNTKQTVNVQS